MTTKLKGYGNFIKEMTDLFVPFTESFYCEKQFYDIQLPDGTIVKHCWAKDGYIIDNMSSPSKFYKPGECCIRLSKNTVNKQTQAPHIENIKMIVLTNIQTIISKNHKNVEYIEKLLGINDLIGPDGTLLKNPELQYHFGDAAKCFLEEEAPSFLQDFTRMTIKEADRKTVLITPVREKITPRLHVVGPDDSEDKAFLRRLQDGMLYENIVNSILVENLITVIELLGINNLDDIIMLKEVLSKAQPVNLKLVCNNLLNKNKRQDSIPENIAILIQLEDILVGGNTELLRKTFKNKRGVGIFELLKISSGAGNGVQIIHPELEGERASEMLSEAYPILQD